MKIHISIYIIFLSLLSNQILAQFTEDEQQKIDSLNQVINYAEHDTSIANAYLSLAEMLYVSNFDTLKYLCEKSISISEKNLALSSSGDIKKSFQRTLAGSLNNIGYFYKIQGDVAKGLDYYNRSLAMQEKLGNRLGIAQSLNNIGMVYLHQGDIEKALEFNFRSLEIAEEIDSKQDIGITFNNIGIVYQHQGDSRKALEYYIKSLKIRQDIGNKVSISVTLTNIGNLHYIQKNYSKSLEYYLQSLKIRRDIKDRIGEGASLTFIGRIYEAEGDAHKALEFYEESLIILEKTGSKRFIASALNGIGTTNEILKNYPKALEYHFKSLEVREEIGDVLGVTNSLQKIGNVYLIQNDNRKAKEFSERSLKMAQELGFPGMVRDAANVLYKIYLKDNNWKSAYLMHDIYFTMRDSILNERTEKDVIYQQANFEVYKKEREIVLLTTKNELLIKEKELQKLKLNRNRIMAISFSIGFGLVLILSVTIFRGYKKKQVINELLQQQKDEIFRKNEEKTAMLREIHHRIKNNLQVVNSLLKLQSYEVEDERVVRMFEECQNRVLSMALLHEKMYRSDDLKHIDIQEHFTLLVKDLVTNYAVGKKIDLDIKVSDVEIGIRTLVPLGLVINEIITNSLKYAFKDQDKGKIKVHLKHLEGIKHEMIIGDDGIGMDRDFKVEESSSLGTELVQIFTEQLMGNMERLDVPGTQFRMEFEKIDKE